MKRPSDVSVKISLVMCDFDGHYLNNILTILIVTDCDHMTINICTYNQSR